MSFVNKAITKQQSSVRVGVRIRPFNKKEKHSRNIITVKDVNVKIKNPETKNLKPFTFNYVFDDVSQETLYESIGKDVVKHTYSGYNTSIFAYGQTGCFAPDTQILMYDGSVKAVQDIKLSDEVMGDDSTMRNVLKLFHGNDTMYLIKPKAVLKPYIVNSEHLLVLKHGESIIEMPAKVFAGLNARDRAQYKGMSTAVQYKSVRDHYHIDPYYYGYSCLPKALLDYYLINDSDVRLAVLAGIIDRHGKVKRNFIRIHWGNDDFINSLRILAQSLGFIVNIIDKTVNIYGKLSLIPMLLNKVEGDYSKYQVNLNEFSVDIKQLGSGEYYGFMLDGNHRFLSADYQIWRNSGKTHTMIGTIDDPGLIPRICYDLFNEQDNHGGVDQGKCEITYKVEISYYEIYSEKVYDLLNKQNVNLKVRQHPEYGPYVENLTKILVIDYKSIKQIILRGNKQRHIASTKMNSRSSRSHAILTLCFTQLVRESGLNVHKEIVSKINLVDLAGSERVEASGVTGINFKEAININKSLSTLGLVISELAARSIRQLGNRGKKQKKHIPFRDSVLTWLLSESLGGNSKTYMIATLSPSSKHYHESLSTLRYAYNAAKIINTVKINEDSNSKLIKILKEEIANLKQELRNKSLNGSLKLSDAKQLQDDIEQRENLIKTQEKTWQEKLEESKKMVERVREQLNAELKQERREAEQRLADIRKTHNEIIKQTKEELETKMSEKEQQITKTEREKTADIIKQYKAQISSMQNTINELKADIIETRKKLTQQHQRFINERIMLSKQIQHLQNRIG